MTRRSGSKPALRSDAANLAQLRAMTPADLEAKTCGQCQVTYRSTKSVKECQAWHAGK